MKFLEIIKELPSKLNGIFTLNIIILIMIIIMLIMLIIITIIVMKNSSKVTIGTSKGKKLFDSLQNQKVPENKKDVLAKTANNRRIVLK